MNRIFLSTSAGVMLLLSSLPLMAQDDAVAMDQLQECRNIADTEERLACFDNISAPAATPEAAVETAAETPVEVEAEAPPAAGAAATAGAAAAAVPEPEAEAEPEVEAEPEAETEAEPEAVVDDDFGLPESPEDYETMSARVARCGEASNRRFYFYLNNGQIWEYMGRTNPRYRGCDSPVIITKDSIGFSLQMEGDKKHRVRRYK